jgi:hypothetical protein
MGSRREWIDIIDWTMIFGVLSALPCAYVWGCVSAQKLFGTWCPGNTVPVVLSVFASVPLSATAGAYGSRLWWLITATAVATIVLFVVRLH